MLYVTTRDDRETYTAQRALREDRGVDGGLYCPFREPAFSSEEIRALLEKPFSQCVAEMLNLLSSARLTGKDVELAIGRNPVRIKALGPRVLAVECWHIPGWSLDALVKNLNRIMIGMDAEKAGNWAEISVRIAVLFGVFAQLHQAGIRGRVDVSLVAGDLSGPISAWYARKSGLPVGSIVCSCNENNGLWELLCHGQFRTDSVSIPTKTPDADITLPANLERLVQACGGFEESKRYLECCQLGKAYFPSEEALEKMREGTYVSVVSGQRMMSTIPSVYRTHGCVLSPYSALAYAGLLDYRAKSGSIRPGIVLMEKSPLRDEDTVAEAMGLRTGELKEYIR